MRFINNLHYDEARGDMLGPPHIHLRPAAVKISSEKELLWTQMKLL